jgi:PEP-CTERM motif
MAWHPRVDLVKLKTQARSAEPLAFADHTHHQRKTDMNKFKTLMRAAAVAASLAGAFSGAQAVNATLYGTQASFIAGLSGAPTVTQDFEGFAVGANLLGVNVLPGVTMSTNLSNLNVFNSAGIGKVAFATTRNLPEAVYNINVNGAYKAFGFEINAYDPLAGGGFLSFYFADGDLTYTFLTVLPPATESTPQFFGVIADKAITKIVWSEGAEIGNFCCEETVIDNLIAAQPVPEPGTGVMLTAGLGAAGWLARRRRTVA